MEASRGARGPRRTRAPGSRGPKQTSFHHLPLTKHKGREMSGGETRKKWISGRPTLRRKGTRVSKRLEILQASIWKIWDKGGQITCRPTVKVKLIILLGSITDGVLVAQGCPCCLRGWFWSPSWERFALRIFRLSQETSWKEETN